MVVIFEGLDGVGKTYLSTLFSRFYDFEYIKESYTNNDNEKVQRVNDLRYRINNNLNYIYDRSTCIDDFVYSFLNESDSSLKDHFNIIKDSLAKCIIFHLIVDENIRSERFGNRGDEYVTNDKMALIERNYIKFYTSLENEIHFFPLSLDEIKDIKKIKEIIDKYTDK